MMVKIKAQMAELVDALVSGTSVRKDVEVRVFLAASPRRGNPPFFVIYRVEARQSNSHRHLMTPGRGFGTIGNNKMK